MLKFIAAILATGLCSFANADVSTLATKFAGPFTMIRYSVNHLQLELWGLEVPWTTTDSEGNIVTSNVKATVNLSNFDSSIVQSVFEEMKLYPYDISIRYRTEDVYETSEEFCFADDLLYDLLSDTDGDGVKEVIGKVCYQVLPSDIVIGPKVISSTPRYLLRHL